MLFYTFFSPRFSGSYWSFGHTLYNLVGGPIMNVIFYTAVTIHILEALFVHRLTVRHRMPFDVGVSDTCSL